MNINFQNGGKVIGSGGFGCVFFPALKCKDQNFRFNGISKLSYKDEIFKEMSLNNKIKPIILKIPNYNKFFLINEIFTCQPEPLLKKDMKNLEKCYFLESLKISKDNINKNIDLFDIINIPYGGKELFELINKNKNIIKNFKYFNDHFYYLLKYAIFPMNNLGLNHNDIKSNNLLIEPKNPDSEIKIIDWALSSVIDISITSYPDIPENIRTRGIQFNLPFSTILFTKNFVEFYKKVLDNLLHKPDITFLKKFVIFYIHRFFFEIGHTNYIINNLFPLVFDINSTNNNSQNENFNNLIKYSLGASFMIEYIAKILLEFTDFNTNIFDEKKYYFEVFRKNSDIWGFLTIYLDILLTTRSKKINYNKNNIINFINKFLYTTEYATKHIPYSLLLDSIQKININIPKNKTKKIKK